MFFLKVHHQNYFIEQTVLIQIHFYF